MTHQHPITPPQELVRQWHQEWIAISCNEKIDVRGKYIATRAARWGADQELEACCAIALSDPCCGTKFQRSNLVRHIKEERRPKQPSLKEQALDRCNDYIDPDGIIRRALEALPDD